MRGILLAILTHTVLCGFILISFYRLACLSRKTNKITFYCINKYILHPSTQSHNLQTPDVIP